MFAFAEPKKKQSIKSIIQKKEKNNKSKSNLTGISDKMKAKFESLSGFAFNDVRVHNSDKSMQLQALAYVQGNQVHIAPRQEKHLDYELGHVVQQKQGMVKSTMSIGSITVNNEPSLETSADKIQFKYGKEGTNSCKSSNACVQRMVAMACPTIDGQNDMVVLTNTKYALNLTSGPVVALGEEPDFSRMVKNENLVIVEHGEPGAIGNQITSGYDPFTAADIASILTVEGKALPKEYLGRIIFLSCNAGTEKGEKPSLAEELKTALIINGYDNVKVCGKKGLALTSEYVGEWTVKPQNDTEYFSEVQFPLVKSKGFAADGEGRVIKPANTIFDEFFNKLTGENREVLNDLKIIEQEKMSIEQKAALMSYITKDFYIELVQQSKISGFLKDYQHACSCGSLTLCPPFSEPL